MVPQRTSRASRTALRLTLIAAVCLQSVAPAFAQPPRSLVFEVSGPGQRLEMVVNSSRILELKFKVPRVLVENPAVLKANPISPKQVQLAAAKAGVTHVTLWDEEGKVHSLDVVVIPDARELEYLLKTQFPEASLKVRPLAASVAISGYCPSAAMVSRVIAVAEDYYPKVINGIEIGGAQQVLLHVKVLEVSRTKLRSLGVDWALFDTNVGFVSQPSGLIGGNPIGSGQAALQAAGSTVSYGIVDGATSFFSYIEALRRNNLLKVLSEPTLTTVSGRAASFNVGGEFPILVPQSLGTVSIEYRQFGTRVDFVPIVRGNGEIRLEVRPQVSEIDASRSVTVQNATIPGLRSRWVDTAAEMRAGQTLALAGLLQNRVETETRSVPVLGDIPVLGSAFRRVEESNNEVELLIMVTPELVEPMDKHEVPPCGPGEFTRRPSDEEFFGNAWLEVPKCCNQCGKYSCKGNCRGAGMDPQQSPQIVPQGGQINTPTETIQPAHNQSTQPPAPIISPSQVNSTPVEVIPQGAYKQQYAQSNAIPVPVQVEPYGSGYSSNAPVITPTDIPNTAEPQVATYRGYEPVQQRQPEQYQQQPTTNNAGYRSQTPGLIGPSGYDEIR